MVKEGRHDNTNEKVPENDKQILADPMIMPRSDEYAALTLYERKSLLVQKELDAMGMGRYQWCIWLLCGFGYFLDLAWAQLFGLVLSPISQELGVVSTRQGDIYVAINVGLTVGAIFWGLSGDIIGRKWAFNLTCLITGVFGILTAAPSNFVAICVLACFMGFGLGGNIPLDTTITLEFLPTNRRFLLATLSMFQPIGVTICTIIGLGLIPSNRCALDLPACSTGEVPCCTKSSNMGWRYQIITIGAITLGIFFLRFFVFHFRESPKYLLSKGRDQDALNVLYSISKFNRGPVPQISMADFEAINQEMSFQSDPELALVGGGAQVSTSEHAARVLKRSVRKLSHLRGLFTNKLAAWSFFVLFIAYISDFFAFNLAGGFLPLILQRRGQEAAQSITTTYQQYCIIYSPGIIGSLLATAAVELPKVGRKYSMVFGACIQGMSMFLYFKVDTIKASVGFNVLEYIAQTFLAAILYAYTPEVFPAPFRASAGGMLSTLGRISGIVAPFAAAPYNNAGSNGILFLAGGASFLCALALVFLPIETRGRVAY